MPPKGPRRQYRRGEVVQVVGDPGNDAFKATNSRKRSSIKLQPSIEKDTIEIESDDETLQPPRKSRPDPCSSIGRIRGAGQKERPAGSRQESEMADRPKNTTFRHILGPGSMFRPFADENADVYIVLVQKDHKYTYRLQSHVLMHASSWFQAPILSGHVVEADPALANQITRRTGIKFRFELIHDKRFGRHVLKRVSLTEHKPAEKPERVVTDAFSASDLKGQYSRSKSASYSRNASMGMPQYDGPFDAAASGNMVGSFDVALRTGFEHPNPSLGTSHSVSELSIDENQDEEVFIKLEKDAEMQMTSTDVVPATQNAIMDQIATPPTSPTQAGTESDNGNTNDDGQAYTGFQNALEGHVAIPLETHIKAESATGEHMFLQTLPVTQASLGGLPEAPVNAEFNSDERDQPGRGSTLSLPSRPISPEEELQMDISIENPEARAIQFAESELAAYFSVNDSSNPTVSPLKDIAELLNATISPSKDTEELEDSELVVEQPQQAISLSVHESSNGRVLPTQESVVPTKANLTVEEAKETTKTGLQMPSNAQAAPKEQSQAPNPKLIEAKDPSKPHPVVEHALEVESIKQTKVSVAVEPKQSAPEPDPKKPSDEPVHPDILDAYHSLFLCYYGFPPTISNADLPTALKQSSILIKIAALYYSLKLVRPHIIASLLSYGRNLYSAIRQDPPRFLILAFKLQCSPIFKEALIHIVGQAPSWPWPTPQDRIPPALAEVMQKKFEHLKEKKANANDALFRSCLSHLGVRVSINNLNKETFDMWVVVQIWHDWFSQQLHTCAVTRRDENRSVERNMYRLMAQGGDAYLQVDEIMAMVRPYQAISVSGERKLGSWDRDQVELEMKIMKGFAAKTVQDLMANELMGDLSESRPGAVEYLTCTQVEERDLPWVAVMPLHEDESRD